MAYKKKQPKVMSDGNIARVGMIVVHSSFIGITRITKLYDTRCNTHIELEFHCPFFPPNGWTTDEIHIRKATPEEKKQYWK
jgi:hypothetical protein